MYFNSTGISTERLKELAKEKIAEARTAIDVGDSRRADDLTEEANEIAAAIENRGKPVEPMGPDGAGRRTVSIHDAEIREHKPAERIERSTNISIGRLVRSRIDNRFKADLNEEERALVQMGSDSAGGYTVDAAQIIAPARDFAPVANACTVLEMPTLNVTLAGIDSDATATIKREGAAIDEAGVTFKGLYLTKKRIAAYVPITKEISQAANAVTTIEDSLKYAVARAMDRMILYGDNETGVQGVEGTTGIGLTDLAGGAITLDQVIDAYYDIVGNNAPDPISFFYNADSSKVFSKKKDGEGQYLLTLNGGTPDVWTKMNHRMTNEIDTDSSTSYTDLFMGNFSAAFLAVQNQWEILVSEHAYDTSHNAFTEGKIMVRILGWADVGLFHPAYFHHLKDALVS